MEKIALILIVLAIVLIPLGCAADQVGAGIREQTVILAHEEAADRVQARQFSQRANEQILAALPVVIWTMAVVLAVIGAGLGSAAIYAAIGVAVAAVAGARLRARTIALAEQTRQFPLVTYGGRRYMIYNPNTGEVVALDDERQPVPQLAAAAGATQLAGAIAREARQAGDPGGVARIVKVIEGECGDAR